MKSRYCVFEAPIEQLLKQIQFWQVLENFCLDNLGLRHKQEHAITNLKHKATSFLLTFDEN